MSYPLRVKGGRVVDVDRFVFDRPYLWRTPVLRAIGDLEALDGLRVLEVGCGLGEMSTFFALNGARVVAVDRQDLEEAVGRFAREWGCEGNVEFMRSDGGPDLLPEAAFDLVFTKSVLWCVEPLDDLLAGMRRALVDGGRAAFVENVYGGPFVRLLRRVVRGPRHRIHRQYKGIRAEQHPLFRRYFDDLEIRSHFGLVLGITGTKRARADADGGDGRPDSAADSREVADH